MSLDMGALVAGAKVSIRPNCGLSYLHLLMSAQFRGEFEERIKAVLKEVKESEGRIVLFIDEIHLVLGAGKAGDSTMDAANLLKPMLARGEVSLVVKNSSKDTS